MTRNRKERYFALVLAFLCIWLELPELVNGLVYPSIQWSYQNPRFKEGTFRLNVLPNSKVSIICPHIATSLAVTDDSLSDNERYENFWIVDEASYHSCNVNKSIARDKNLLKCDDPAKLKFERLSFQSFRADSDLKFIPEKTYYFVSTSTGSQNSLDSRSKGHCETNNMKLQIYICKDSQDIHCSEAKSTVPVMSAVESTVKRTTASITTTKQTSTVRRVSTTLPSFTKAHTTQPPVEPFVSEVQKGEEETNKPVNHALWTVITIILVLLLAVSVGLNMSFFSSNRCKRRSKRPDYGREDSCKPSLMANQMANVL